MALDGSEQKRLVSGVVAFGLIPAPDGRWIYFTALADSRNGRAMKLAAEGGSALPVSDEWFAPGDVTADGSELIGMTFNHDRNRLDIAVLPTSGGRLRLLADAQRWQSPAATGSLWYRFCPGTNLLSYFVARDGMWNVFGQPISGGPERQLTRFRDDPAARIVDAAWSRDRRLAVARSILTTDVVLMTAK